MAKIHQILSVFPHKSNNSTLKVVICNWLFSSIICHYVACVWRQLLVIKELTRIFVWCCQHKSFLHHAASFSFIIKLFFSHSLMLPHRSCRQAFETVSLVTCIKASAGKKMRNCFRSGWLSWISWLKKFVCLQQESYYFQKEYAFCTVTKKWLLAVLMVCPNTMFKSPMY